MPASCLSMRWTGFDDAWPASLKNVLEYVSPTSHHNDINWQLLKEEGKKDHPFHAFLGKKPVITAQRSLETLC